MILEGNPQRIRNKKALGAATAPKAGDQENLEPAPRDTLWMREGREPELAANCRQTYIAPFAGAGTWPGAALVQATNLPAGFSGNECAGGNSTVSASPPRPWPPIRPYSTSPPGPGKRRGRATKPGKGQTSAPSFADGRTAPCQCKRLQRDPRSSWLLRNDPKTKTAPDLLTIK